MGIYRSIGGLQDSGSIGLRVQVSGSVGFGPGYKVSLVKDA